MKSTSLLTIFSMVAGERAPVHEDDYTTQLQTRKMPTDDPSKSQELVAGFLEQMPRRKMDPAELLANEMSVTELAKAVEESGKDVDENTKKRLEEFKAFILELEDDIMDDHKKDQNLIDKADTDTKTCFSDFTAASNDNEKLAKQMSDHEDKHAECRKKQKELMEKAIASCEDLYTYQDGLVRVQEVPGTSNWLKDISPPTCEDVSAPDTNTFSKYFTDALSTLESQRKAWELRTKACKDDSDAHVAQKATCDQDQLNFETTFCGWRSAAYHNCADQANCFGSGVEETDTTVKLALQRAAVRKEHWRASKHYTCFLDVLLHSKNFTGCQEDVDYTVLDFDIPAEHDKPKCDLSGTLSLPGHSSWSKKYYDDSDCEVSDDHHVCEPIPDKVIQAAYGSSRNTFVRWGHRECPEDTFKLFTGYAAGAHHGHQGSGYNTLCLHPEPTYPEGVNGGNHNGGLIYGTEYQNTGALDKNHDQEGVCAVCAVQGATFTQWGRNKCPDDAKQEYKGLVMANHYGQQRGMYVCVDEERMVTEKSSSSNHDGNMWYTTEFETGSLPGAVFKHDHEVSCAQCTLTNSKNTYVRWGSRECPKGATELYTGYVGKDYYTHHGSGANTLCLHPEPNYPAGYSGGNQNGALIYGTEYENTGAVDKNHDKDAVCTLCAVQGATYTQWGRDECPSGQEQEYKGVIMADHYGHHKSLFVCVDVERAVTEKSNNHNHNGNLWYTTEYETGSLPSSVYKHDHEASCAQCTAMDVSDIYVRWGHRECPVGANKLYTGYTAGESHSHRGGGANLLCLHPEPTYPEGVSGGNHNGALLYGTEYENTGAVDRHHDHDSVCSVCGVQGTTFTQWGRDVCPEGHRMEYKGVVMSSHYGHKKGEFVCVDEDRQYTSKSSAGNNNGHLLYTVEFEVGSLPSSVFKHDHEVSCAQCSTAPAER